MNRAAKKKPGPARKTGPGVVIATRCQKDFTDRLDKWRASQPEKPERGTALRLLAESGLEAKGY